MTIRLMVMNFLFIVNTSHNTSILSYELYHKMGILARVFGCFHEKIYKNQLHLLVQKSIIYTNIFRGGCYE